MTVAAQSSPPNKTMTLLQQFVKMGSLSETQHKSIKSLGRWTQRPLPPSLSSSSSSSSQGQGEGEGSLQIENLQQFNRWFDEVESQLGTEEESDHSLHVLFVSLPSSPPFLHSLLPLMFDTH